MAKAKYYLMTADFVSGPEAERIGLVTRCVPDAEVVPASIAVAERLARESRTAVQWTKRALNQWLVTAVPAFSESLALEMLGFLGPDAREGLAALRERRPPQFPSAQVLSGLSRLPACPTPDRQPRFPESDPDQETVTSVPIGVRGKTTAALAGGISTQPSLWGKP